MEVTDLPHPPIQIPRREVVDALTGATPWARRGFVESQIVCYGRDVHSVRHAELVHGVHVEDDVDDDGRLEEGDGVAAV